VQCHDRHTYLLSVPRPLSLDSTQDAHCQGFRSTKSTCVIRLFAWTIVHTQHLCLVNSNMHRIRVCLFLEPHVRALTHADQSSCTAHTAHHSTQAISIPYMCILHILSEKSCYSSELRYLCSGLIEARKGRFPLPLHVHRLKGRQKNEIRYIADIDIDRYIGRYRYIVFLVSIGLLTNRYGMVQG
jgi:hypothetical protein